MSKNQPLWLGKLGKELFVIVVASVVVTAIALPYVMVPLHLVFPQKWVLATRLVIQVTFGSWVATAMVSIARIVAWWRAVHVETLPVDYDVQQRDVGYVSDFSLWLLGILTALAAYMTVWVSG